MNALAVDVKDETYLDKTIVAGKTKSKNMRKDSSWRVVSIDEDQDQDGPRAASSIDYEPRGHRSDSRSDAAQELTMKNDESISKSTLLLNHSRIQVYPEATPSTTNLDIETSRTLLPPIVSPTTSLSSSF
jgi:hypothetical protein